jgi:hypothetical protein
VGQGRQYQGTRKQQSPQKPGPGHLLALPRYGYWMTDTTPFVQLGRSVHGW